MLTSPRCHRGAHAAHLEGELPEQDKSGVIPIPDMIKSSSAARGSRPRITSTSGCRNRGAPSPGHAYQRTANQLRLGALRGGYNFFSSYISTKKHLGRTEDDTIFKEAVFFLAELAAYPTQSAPRSQTS